MQEKKGKATWSGLGLQQCQLRKELKGIPNGGKDTIVTKKGIYVSIVVIIMLQYTFVGTDTVLAFPVVPLYNYYIVSLSIRNN